MWIYDKFLIPHDIVTTKIRYGFYVIGVINALNLCRMFMSLAL